ncbi:MAG: type II secretion system F family protein [Acidobacteria bacterium]|nr:type II secretion system F family protein [Acidobacteriota bacterium]
MTENLGLLAGFFVFVLGAITLSGYFFTGRKEETSPRDLDGPRELARDPGPLTGEEDSSVKSWVLALLRTLGERMPSSPENRRKIEQRLSYAGYRGAPATTAYFGVKSTSAGILGVVLAGLALWNQGEVIMMFAAAMCGLGFGFLLPERFLDFVISGRNSRLRRALPSAIDLMVMSLEAGQAVDQAILLASRGLERFASDLASELDQVILETRSGSSRAESLRRMSERNSEPEIRKFCTLLLDSDRFGSSLAPTLRQHSKYMRIRFRQRAQETARKITVKMVFPVFFLIFPAILVVTLGPAAMRMYYYFQEMAK